MTRREKLERLNDLVIDVAITELESGEVTLKDIAPIITLLKNNQVVEDKKAEFSEADLIEELVEDKK